METWWVAEAVERLQTMMPDIDDERALELAEAMQVAWPERSVDSAVERLVQIFDEYSRQQQH